MRIVTDISEANILLKGYFGADAQVMIFDSSLQRLAIRLKSKSHAEVMYVVGIGCEQIKGSFNWHEAQIHIIQNSKERDELITIISDKSNDFELKTSAGFSTVIGAESEFGNSFDNFLRVEKI